MKKLLISVMSVAVVVGIGVYATNAYFTDKETSTGNTFTAGALDLKVDSTCHYDNMICQNGFWASEANKTSTYPDLIGKACSCTWTSKDLGASCVINPIFEGDGDDDVGECAAVTTPDACNNYKDGSEPISECMWQSNDMFFNFSDVKPGDVGEDTISLTAVNNNSWVCAYVNNLQNNDNACNGPELQAEQVAHGVNGATCGASTAGIGQGELQDNLFVTIWRDTNCDNIQTENEPTLVLNAPIDHNGGGWPLYDSSHGSPLTGNTTACLGVKWSVPTDTGNIIQTDSVTGDVTFYAVQSRNNLSFVCPGTLPQ